MLIAGEVQTGVLRGGGPVTGDVAARLVDLVTGEAVLVSERPRSYVRAPDKPVGVDCPIGASGPNRRPRGIGTAWQRAAILDGHVVQGSAYATIRRAEQSARQPWSYYMTRPGVIESVGRTRWKELADAFAAPVRDADALDLGGIAGQAADRVQRNHRAGGRPGLRAARTRLRWTALVEPCDPSPCEVHFATYGEDLRVLSFTVSEVAARRVAVVAEDIALHDWLLTVLLEEVRKAAIGVLPRDEVIRRLLPAIDYLLHLWLPRTTDDDLARALWSVLENRVGLSRQWNLLVYRIRDQLSAGAVAALSAAIRQ
ncbi:SCO2521 family protein [Actinoplanes subtropicus]|uniref:SCO2521 family protein n=1 Tax=Actinoplanes subtropicus TaxID=543632 RepID=UPI0004C328CC|nr:SCO2521 family protein [Actinoplanes subtropicus]